MIAGNFIQEIADTQLIIVDKRDTGKSTLLRQIIQYHFDNNRMLALIDTAVEHAEKSVLIFAQKQYPHNISIKINEDSKKIAIKQSIMEASEKKLPLFIDLSYFLEKSHDYTGIKRKITRNRYRQYFRFIISVLVKEKTVFSIVVDEVEVDIGTLLLLKNNEHFVLTTHDYLFKQYIRSFFSNILSMHDINDGCVFKYRVRRNCGSRCLMHYYRLQKKYCNNIRNVYWFFDVCSVLDRMKEEYKVYYFQSNLIDSYQNGTLPYKKSVNIIKKIDQRGRIIKKQVEKHSFIEDFREYNACIMIVKSSILHRQEMEGGHYILLLGNQDFGGENIFIHNPARKRVLLEERSFNEILLANSEYGGFRIFIGKR